MPVPAHGANARLAPMRAPGGGGVSCTITVADHADHTAHEPEKMTWETRGQKQAYSHESTPIPTS